jgi:hypothetical protein
MLPKELRYAIKELTANGEFERARQELDDFAEHVRQLQRQP